MQSSTVSAISPSFTSYSSNNLADIAARVVEEFRHDNHNNNDYDDIFNFNDHDHDHSKFSVPNNDCNPEHNHDDTDDDDEFEFAVVRTDVNNLHIIPQYPLFDRNLLLDVDPSLINFVNNTTEIVRLPLHKLFSEEREFASSESTSSESDDIDGVNPSTYCVWKPPEKSSSSRRWKIRDILFRSKSDSKTTSFVKKIEKTAKVADVAVTSENRGSRRRLYLPFRKALVDAFSNVSQSNRNLRPF